MWLCIVIADSRFLFIQRGVFQSGQMGQTVNLLLFSFGGSNPSAPTFLFMRRIALRQSCASSSRALQFVALQTSREKRRPCRGSRK